MSEITYGDADEAGWLFFFHDSTLLAIDLPSTSDLIQPLWELVAASTGAAAVLDILTRNGLAAIPGFVFVSGVESTAATVVVRGDVSFSAGRRGGQLHEVKGTGISSWAEQVVDTSSGFEVRTAKKSTGSPPLPLRSGVVRAHSISRATAGIEPRTAATIVPVPVTLPSAPIEVVIQGAPALSPQAILFAPVVTHAEAASRNLEETLASEANLFDGEADIAPPASAEKVSGYDHLFGATVVRSVEDAAIREGEPQSESSTDANDDGHTVMQSDIAALRKNRKAARAAASNSEPLAPVFELLLSTGGSEVLNQPLVVGRAPTASSGRGGTVPRLVIMNTPNQDISRTHVEVSVEGGTVVVTDLHSSNGTTVTLPGMPSQRLRPGEPAAVILGAIIDLGDGATLTVCEKS